MSDHPDALAAGTGAVSPDSHRMYPSNAASRSAPGQPSASQPPLAVNPLLNFTSIRGAGFGWVPNKGDDGAPKTFKGDASKLGDFLERVDKILIACGITSDSEKVKTLYGYLGGDAKAFIREQQAYKTQSYNELVKVLKEAYPTSRYEFRYTTKDLERVASRYHSKKLTHLEDLAKYRRHFQKVGLWLKSKDKIDEERYNRTFWDGLPTNWQHLLKTAGDKFGLTIDPKETPKADEVLAALQKALDYSNFDADLKYRKGSKSRKSRRSRRAPSSDSDTSSSADSSDESSSDSGSDSDTDSDDGGKSRRKGKHRKHKDPSTVSTTEADIQRLIQSAVGRVHESSLTVTKPASGVDELVRRLAGLEPGTTEYLLIWADLVKTAPHVAKAIQTPVTSHQVSVNAINQARPRLGNFDNRCYGCGEPGHLMRDCQAVQAYIDEGVLYKLPDGRLRVKNGMMPIYSGDRPLVKQLREMVPAPAQVTNSGNGPVFNSRLIELDKEGDATHQVHATARVTRAARDGRESAPRTRAQHQAAATPPGILRVNPAQPPPQEQASVVGATVAPTEAAKQATRFTLKGNMDKEYGSGVTAKMLLSQQVSVPFGSLLAQPSIQKALLPMVQRHRHYDAHKVGLETDDYPEEADVGHLERHLDRALYSSGVGKAPISINGMSFTAILDSGSEINVLTKETSDFLGLPLIDYHGAMRTADGHTSPMRHIAINVLVELGGIKTPSNFYIIEGPRYQVLLGRPWQRQVGYEHRDVKEGMMVTIKDPIDHHVHSFLAAPALQSNTHSAYLPKESEVVCEPTGYEEAEGTDKLVAGVYKSVARKVRPVAAAITEDDRIKLDIPADFEADLPPLPHHPPAFTPGQRLTRERLEKIDIDPDQLLNPEEYRLLLHVLVTNERALAFDETEKGAVDPRVVPPIRIPVVEHEVWDKKKIPISPALRETVRELVQAKVDSGLYEPSSAAYTSPWFPVAKKTPGQYRIVHDLQPLNAVTIRNPGRLPPIDQFVGGISGRACMGTLDMFSGFDQIWLAVESRDLTTFETDIGRFRHTRLPQGGTNSCIVFHYIVVKVVGPAGQVYVDDVVVPGPASRYNDECIPGNSNIRRFVFEYLTSLHKVLFRLGKVGMTVSGHKMAPIRRSATVLGQEVSDKGRRVAQDKVDAIRKWTDCCSVTEVRSFLGIAGQARSWIPDYSVLVKPLTYLVKKGVPFEWGPEQQEAMEKIKTIVMQRAHLVELKYGRDAEPIQLGVDAGPLACGFWLGQKDEDGIIQVARYGSLPFDEREQRYSQPKRELYAVFRALKHFQHWLYAAKVVIRTDASFVKGMIANPELPNSAMTRWLAYIMLFDIEVVHVPARNNALADGLSRRPIQPDDKSVTDDDAWVADRFEQSLLLSCAFPSGGNEVNRVELKLPADEIETPLPVMQVFSISGGKHTAQPPSQKHLSPEHQAIFDFLESGVKPETTNDYQANRRFIQRASRYFVAGQLLWRKGGLEESGRLVVDDESERDRVIRELHDESGHKGIGATVHALEQRFFWQGLGNTVKEWIKTCDSCQKRERGIIESAIRATVPPGLFQRFGLDITYLPKTEGYRYLVVARDDLSGWVVARALKKKTARAVARFLVDEVFTRHGLPLQITTDQGTEFKGIVSVLLRKYHIDIVRTSPFNPRANGAVERGHKSLKDSIVHAARALDIPWPQVVHIACWFDRTMVRRQYGHSPFFLIYGQEPILPVDLSTPDLLTRYAQVPDDQDALDLAIKERISRLGSHKELVDLAQKRKEEDRKQAAARRNLQDMLGEASFAPGQLVLIRNFSLLNTNTAESKTEDRWLGPFMVITQSLQGGVWVRAADGSVLPSSIHASHVKAYRPRIRARLGPEHGSS